MSSDNASEMFDFLFEKEDYKVAEDHLKAALLSNDVNAEKPLKEELFSPEMPAIWKSETIDFSVEDLLGSYLVENDLPSAEHIKEESFEPFKDLVSLPFDSSFMESLETAGLEAASDSGLSTDNIADMMLSPSSGVTSPDHSVDISTDTLDAISDVSSTSDLGSMGSVGSSPNGSSRISFTSPPTLDTEVDLMGNHYDDDVEMSDFQASLNSVQEKVSVSPSINRKPVVVTAPQYSIKLSSYPSIISTSTTQQKSTPPTIATRSIKLAQPTRIVKSVTPTSNITTSNSSTTKTPILTKLRLDASSLTPKITATSTTTKATSPQTIVVTQAGKSTPLLRNGALLKTGNGTSILLPVNVNDLNQVRTIKIISAGSNTSTAGGTSNVRTLVSTVRPTTTNTSATQGSRATYYTTSKGSDGRSLLKVTPTALVTPTAHTEVPHRRVNPSYIRDDQSDDEAPQPNQELTLNDEERKLMRKEGIVLPSRYPLTKQEERDLKRIRRKIRNKISAQDSRKRKKEYVDGLEDRVKNCTDENQQLQKRIKTLEKHNESLIAQMKKFQSLIGGSFQHRPNTHTSTALMMLILSAALFVVPSLRSQDSKAENELTGRSKMPPAGHTRSLLEAKHALNMQNMEGFTPTDEEEIDPLNFSNALSDHDYSPSVTQARIDNDLLSFFNPSIDKTMAHGKGDPPDTIGGLNGVASLIGAVFDRLGRNWTDSGGRFGGAANSTPPHSLPERSSVVVNLNHGRRMRDDIELE